MYTKIKIKFALWTFALYLFASHNLLMACCRRYSDERQRKAQQAIINIIKNEPDEPSICKKLMPYKEYIATEPLSIFGPVPLYVAMLRQKNHATIFCLENGASANQDGSQRISPLYYNVSHRYTIL